MPRDQPHGASTAPDQEHRPGSADGTVDGRKSSKAVSTETGPCGLMFGAGRALEQGRNGS